MNIPNVASDLISNSKYIHKITHILNTELMQFSLGKTEKSMNHIEQDMIHWLKYLETNNDTVPGTLVIPIILTNNSLAETEQWTIRLKGVFPDLKIKIVSSKHTADYSHGIEIISVMKECDIKDIPNVIVMCTNSSRLDTCFQLFNAFSHLSHSPRNDVIIRFNAYFDEIDKQTGLLKKFIENINNHKYMCALDVEETLIQKIIYITATPDPNFWKTLVNKLDIPELENIDGLIEENYTRPDHEELVKNYKSILNDCLIIHNSESLPVNYVTEVLNGDTIDLQSRNIIFAPAENKTKTHDEMSSVFKKLDFTVLKHNGHFKGFEYPNGDTMTLETFKETHFTDPANVQMMDVLRKWYQLKPDKSLAITGNTTIERGVTFNTDGFNFTHIIISPYHARKMNKLLQLVGRDHGHRDYCKPCQFITTDKIFKTCKEYIENFHKIKEAQIEKYNLTDFTDSPSTIPVKIVINDIILNEFLELVREIPEQRGRLSNVLKEKRKKVYDNIHTFLQDNKDTANMEWNDRNNRGKINLSERTLLTCRIYRGGEGKGRRYKQFHKNYEKRKPAAQKGDSANYSLDICLKKYNSDDFTNSPSTIWLTYRKYS